MYQKRMQDFFLHKGGEDELLYQYLTQKQEQ